MIGCYNASLGLVLAVSLALEARRTWQDRPVWSVAFGGMSALTFFACACCLL